MKERKLSFVHHYFPLLVKVSVQFNVSEISILIEYRYQNCKTWYESGYTINGIYLINPDGGTPFKVLIT